MYFSSNHNLRPRSSQRSCGSHSFSRTSPPTTNLSVEIAAPCGACKIPYQCPVPSFSMKLGPQCMYHMMSAYRTWVCVYNINSFCAYSSSKYTCFAQPGAPESEHFLLAKKYRDIELKYYKATFGRKRNLNKSADYALELTKLKQELLNSIGAQNLTVCAYYPIYKELDHLAVINKTDSNIPRLLTSHSITIKNQAIEV